MSPSSSRLYPAAAKDHHQRKAKRSQRAFVVEGRWKRDGDIIFHRHIQRSKPTAAGTGNSPILKPQGSGWRSIQFLIDAIAHTPDCLRQQDARRQNIEPAHQAQSVAASSRE